MNDPAAARDTRPGPGADAGLLGMRIFLLSLSVLFTAGILAFLAVRARAPEWPPAGSPGLPGSLWLSTGILLVSSLTIWRARRAADGESRERLFRFLAVTFALGLLFLASQGASWALMIERHVVPRQSLFAFTFYVLSALHALHVVGGLVPLGILTGRAGRRSASPSSVRYVAMYWHFLDVVWVILFAVLML